MVEMSRFENINPYVRMMRIKKASCVAGKWRDIDNVFTYIAAGSADFILEGVHYSLQTGSAIIIPPYMTHVILSNGTAPLVQYIMHFDFYETEERKKLVHKDVLDEAEKHLALSEQENILQNGIIISEIPETERNSLIARYLNLVREFKGQEPGRMLMMKAECMGLLAGTLRHCIEVDFKPDTEGRKTKSWVHIENAMEYILSCDLTDRLDNVSIAAAIGVSPNYLTRMFQVHLGISLHKYIINVRVERAQQLLLSGRVNITEAANLTGFSGIHVFSKSFKNILGISPSEFLDEVANKEHIAETMGEIADLPEWDAWLKQEKHAGGIYVD